MIRIKETCLGKARPLMLIILVGSFLCAALAWAQPDEKARPLVGGPCRYKSYPGYATILSITGIDAADRDKVRRFEVKFSFSPQSKITEPFAQVEGKTFHLHGNNFQYPDREFLAANDIQVGRVLEGRLQTIVSGTCTPVLFEFPVLQRGK